MPHGIQQAAYYKNITLSPLFSGISFPKSYCWLAHRSANPVGKKIQKPPTSDTSKFSNMSGMLPRLSSQVDTRPFHLSTLFVSSARARDMTDYHLGSCIHPSMSCHTHRATSQGTSFSLRHHQYLLTPDKASTHLKLTICISKSV